MMEATKEGRSRNILLNAKCVVCCHHEYIYIYQRHITFKKYEFVKKEINGGSCFHQRSTIFSVFY